MENKELALFEAKQIRRHYDKENEIWFFSIIDIIEALTESSNPRDYWFKMKQRVKTEDGFELSTICRQLKLKATDGKMRLTDVADVKGIFRLIQSIPSPKAEPFKKWLAQVGAERIAEIDKPELAQARIRAAMIRRATGNISIQMLIFRNPKILNILTVRSVDSKPHDAIPENRDRQGGSWGQFPKIGTGSAAAVKLVLLSC